MIVYGKELYHFGIKGQKWGLRKYQNEDGTLTPEGRIHYGVDKYKKEPSGGSIKKQMRVEQAKNRLKLVKGKDRIIAKKELKEAKKDLTKGFKEYRKFEKDMHKAYGKYSDYVADPDNNFKYTNKKNGLIIKDWEYKGLVNYAMSKEVNSIRIKNAAITGLAVTTAILSTNIGKQSVNKITRNFGFEFK